MRGRGRATLARAGPVGDARGMTIRGVLSLLSLGTALAGCGDDGGGGDGSPSFARVQAEVFDVGCSVKSCHSSTAKAGDLVLEAGKSHAELVGVAAVQTKAVAEGLLRVTAGDPDASFLLTKCTAPLAAEYGDVMPWGNPDGLDVDKLELLRAWIEAGAPAE